MEEASRRGRGGTQRAEAATEEPPCRRIGVSAYGRMGDAHVERLTNLQASELNAVQGPNSRCLLPDAVPGSIFRQP